MLAVESFDYYNLSRYNPLSIDITCLRFNHLKIIYNDFDKMCTFIFDSKLFLNVYAQINITNKIYNRVMQYKLNHFLTQSK